MSNEAGTQSSYPINEAQEQSGRRIKEDGIVINEADELILERYGTSLINGKPQGTVFGTDMVISQEKPQISGKWDLGIEVSGTDVLITTTGYVQIETDESTLNICTGIAADGSVVLTSESRIRYEPGTPIFAKFTLAFPEPSESNGDYTVGLSIGEGFDIGDSGIGIYQRRVSDVIEYGVILVRDGVSTYYPYNGELPPNPENLNIYRVEWGYLGVAPFNIYWRDTTNEVWVRLHRQVFEQKITSLTKPDLPIGAFAINEGNTTDLCLRNGSYEAGTINGGFEFDPGARPQLYDRDFSAPSGVNQLIFAFKNPLEVDMYDGVDISGIPTVRSFRNSIASQLLQVSLSAFDNNKLVDIEAVIVPTSDIVGGTWTPVSLGYSVLEVSEDVVPVLTNAITIEIFTRSKDQALKEEILTKDLLLPGYTALFMYTSTSVTFDFSAFIKYQDLF